MSRPGVLEALAAGALAGLFAAYVAEKAQARLAQALPAVRNTEETPATIRAADKIAVAVGGGPVPTEQREKAGRAVHYATGAALGAAYGLIARSSHAVTAAFGMLYGALTALILDETVAPALGLAPDARKVPPETHLYSLSSHLAYGVALEAGRRLLTRG